MASPCSTIHLGHAMLETFHVAAANLAAIDPNLQQALGLLLASTALLGVGVGMAVGGLWMHWANR